MKFNINDIIISVCQCIFILTVGTTLLRALFAKACAIHYMDSFITASTLMVMGGNFLYMKMYFAASTSFIVAFEWAFMAYLYLHYDYIKFRRNKRNCKEPVEVELVYVAEETVKNESTI